MVQPGKDNYHIKVRMDKRSSQGPAGITLRVLGHNATGMTMGEEARPGATDLRRPT